jgi:peptidoglycan-N-acetylglucosamine deacetylase
VKCVALTFDDGPGPCTGQLLDTLADHGARATFFDIGQNAAASPGLVRRQHEEGHEIGNHSWSHPDLTRLPPEEVRAQLDRTSRAIEDATGRPPALLRPPYGARNDAVAQQAGQAGMPLILWNVDTEDWKYRDSDHVTNAVLSTVQPGSVVLMHDIHETTVAAVPGILDALAGQGYHFVTVSELYGGTDALTAGALYYGN